MVVEFIAVVLCSSNCWSYCSCCCCCLLLFILFRASSTAGWYALFAVSTAYTVYGNVESYKVICATTNGLVVYSERGIAIPYTNPHKHSTLLPHIVDYSVRYVHVYMDVIHYHISADACRIATRLFYIIHRWRMKWHDVCFRAISLERRIQEPRTADGLFTK